jgi:hypothetical protein
MNSKLIAIYRIKKVAVVMALNVKLLKRVHIIRGSYNRFTLTKNFIKQMFFKKIHFNISLSFINFFLSFCEGPFVFCVLADRRGKTG